MPEALKIAIVGAESTGKSTLALDLAAALAQQTGLRCAAVPEWLREWCEIEGRTPRRDEQRAIAQGQQQRIDAAAAENDVVICDTTPLMTAVYSKLLFDDHSLDAVAARWQAGMHLTLLTALDLPWVADGLQRDGEHVRVPVDNRLRELLADHGLPWSLVAGSGATRLQHALDAATPLLRQRAAPRAGLFTRLAERDAAAPPWPWLCDCDDPGCEHAVAQAAARPR